MHKKAFHPEKCVPSHHSHQFNAPFISKLIASHSSLGQNDQDSTPHVRAWEINQCCREAALDLRSVQILLTY